MNNILDSAWQKSGTKFYPADRSIPIPHVGSGIFKLITLPNGSWYLEQTTDFFKFPYKILLQRDDIIDRVMQAWDRLEGNLGILLNGTKGTGKTVTAQLIANEAVRRGIPVIVVSQPTELEDVLSRLKQQVIIFFDEFEKVYPEPEHQQTLLSILDGTVRSEHKRMFLFTTNNPTLEDNLQDRPGRIRYCWNFDRLSEADLVYLMNELLSPHLDRYRPEILEYLGTRQILTMDTVKAVISEVNAFEQPPDKFETILNLSEQLHTGYTLDVIGKNSEVLFTITDSFNCRNKHYSLQLKKLLSKAGLEDFENSMMFNDLEGYSIKMIKPTDNCYEWICEITVDVMDTWVKEFPNLLPHCSRKLWKDVMPEDWHVPSWAKKKNVTSSDDFSNWDYSSSVFGTSTFEKFLVRFTPNKNMKVFKSGYVRTV